MENMTDAPKIPDAQSLGQINIHLGYITQTISEIKMAQKETSTKIENLGTTLVTQIEFEAYKKQVQDTANTAKELVEWKDTLTGKIAIISASFGVVVGVLTIIVNHVWK